MTVNLDITKTELIAAIGRALISAGRTEEATLFYRLANLARDVQEVMRVVPDGVQIEYANG
jgi:hypothetical protein